MKRSILALSAALMALSICTAQAQTPPPIKLTLTPAKPPTPALRYQLLPDARITITGDAAPIYKQALELLKKTSFNQEWKQLNSWLELSTDKLPKDEVRKTLAEYGEIYALLDKAARCDNCNWDLLERLRKGGPDALSFPDMMPLRQCVTLLELRARLDMADGRFDKAIVAFRNILALARHIGERETLFSFLMGIACAIRMERQLDDYLGQAEAPNLYYALTDLPSPLLSMRKGLEGERVFAYGQFPGLGQVIGNLDAGNLTPKQLEDCAKVVEGGDKKYTQADRNKLAKAIQDKHEIAKKALIVAGRPRDKVEAMPYLQVALLHMFLEYDTILDEMIVWNHLPYAETLERLNRLHKRVTEDREKDPNAPAIPMVTTFVSSVRQVKMAQVRNDRKIAVLRTIEAIRFYAAMHDGKLPLNLAAIKEVPIPLDPITGKSFEYQLKDETATLWPPTPNGETANAINTVVYMLHIRQ